MDLRRESSARSVRTSRSGGSRVSAWATRWPKGALLPSNGASGRGSCREGGPKRGEMTQQPIVQEGSAQAKRRSPHGRLGLWHRPGAAARHGRGDRPSGRLAAPRWPSSSGAGNIFRGVSGRLARDRPGHRRLHGDAGHGHELHGAAGCAAEAGYRLTGAVGDPHAGDLRALHPGAGHPPSGEGQSGDLRGRHGQSLLQHRHSRRAACLGDRGRMPA